MISFYEKSLTVHHVLGESFSRTSFCFQCEKEERLTQDGDPICLECHYDDLFPDSWNSYIAYGFTYQGGKIIQIIQNHDQND